MIKKFLTRSNIICMVIIFLIVVGSLQHYRSFIIRTETLLIENNIIIKEFSNGKYQVWKSDKVLTKTDKNWENSESYAGFSFTFFQTYSGALSATEDNLIKNTVVKIHLKQGNK